MYPLAENADPYAAKTEKTTRVDRKGNVVHVCMTSVRSHFMPDKIEGIQVGDSVYFHITNLEQDWDVPHGFAVLGANNSELLIMPGQTRTLVWVPQPGGRVPVLLHRLLLGAAPGDAGLHPGVAQGLGGGAQVEQPELHEAASMRRASTRPPSTEPSDARADGDTVPSAAP